MNEQFLMVVHQEVSNTGRMGAKLVERGYELDIRCPMQGEPLPESMDSYVGAVVFGGPMSANDDDTLPGIRAELDWIPVALDSGKPFLGVCLGAQLLARVLGAVVKPHPEGMAEIGYFEVRPTAAGAHIFDAPLSVYHWHVEGFELPGDTVLLAQGALFRNQAYRYRDNAFGIQFHPEVTRAMMEHWLESGSERLELPGAQPPDDHLAGHARHDAALGQWLERFLDGWLAADQVASIDGELSRPARSCGLPLTLEIGDK